MLELVYCVPIAVLLNVIGPVNVTAPLTVPPPVRLSAPNVFALTVTAELPLNDAPLAVPPLELLNVTEFVV